MISHKLQKNKMFSILLIPLGAFLYFDFVCSFQSFPDLKTHYIENVWKLELNEIKYSICDVSYARWAGFCTKVLIEIRKNEFYDSLRVSYSAFYRIPLDEKCKIQKLGFLTPLPNGKYTVDQQMMVCFGRQAIASATEPIDQYKYYNKLAIYPSNENTMMVFKYDEVSEVFMLLETYEDENWLQTEEVPNELLALAPPQYIQDSDLQAILIDNAAVLEKASNDLENVINRINVDIRYEIQYMVIKNTPLKKYGTMVPLEELQNPPSRFSLHGIKMKTHVIMLSTDLGTSSNELVEEFPKKRAKKSPKKSAQKSVKEFFLWTYVCYVRRPDQQKPIYLKMAAGPHKNSVLFLHHTSHQRESVYKIKLMITNLHPQLLSYYL